MSDLNAFRNETRDWLEANCPESMRTPMSQGDVVWGGRKVEFKDPDQKIWKVEPSACMLVSDIDPSSSTLNISGSTISAFKKERD